MFVVKTLDFGDANVKLGPKTNFANIFEIGGGQSCPIG